MLRTAVAGLVFTVSISVAQNWTTLPAGAAPPISGHAATAFDPLRGRLVCVVDELLDYSTGPGALARITTWGVGRLCMVSASHGALTRGQRPRSRDCLASVVAAHGHGQRQWRHVDVRRLRLAAAADPEPL